MDYEKISSKVPGSGVQGFDQSVEAARERVHIGDGVCRALVVHWLVAKARGEDYWTSSGKVTEPLLAASTRLSKAVRLQEEYERVAQSRLVLDPATEQALSEGGLGFVIRDTTASAQWGFATEKPNDEPEKIVHAAFDAHSRAFILSIKGTSGGHSLGVYRHSREVHLFDPNIGEFVAKSEAGLRALLLAIAAAYREHRMNLHDSYILWSFAG
ncbi:virulence surface antigen [Amycolatopsis pretoriensis]|uniref:Virulence surface antigen n=1 Tax=Amycolatopsis pretoriensis TaxID=218821 RepID=A0A1H5QMI2_9PSEU|nr:YopT-type cysteine protease domain-containing protein [Amycolatopsis pretoriensis]SEF26561.1 virulence surface antigen [Amycolatopsis pretoriensis]